MTPASTTTKHPRDLIRAALAHMDEGGAQIRDGGGHSGPPLHDTADQGWTLELEPVWNPQQPGPRGERLLAYRYYVDHVGMGRRDALPMYLSAVRAAGLEAELAPLPGGGRPVVRLAGVYDGEGRRIG